jgi:hypothetical protein
MKIVSNLQEAMLDTIRKTLTASQLCKLEKFGGRITKFGVNFTVFDTRGELVLLCEGEGFKSSKEQLTDWARQVLVQSNATNAADFSIQRFGDENIALGVVLKSARVYNNSNNTVGAVLIDLGDTGAARIDTDYFVEMLGLLAEEFHAEVNLLKALRYCWKRP